MPSRRSAATDPSSCSNTAPDRLDEFEVLERFQEPERVAAADEDSVGVGNRLERIADGMGGGHGVAHLGEPRAGFGRVAIAVVQCEGKEEDNLRMAKKFSDLFFGVIEITAAVDGGVADEENVHKREAFVTDVTSSYRYW